MRKSPLRSKDYTKCADKNSSLKSVLVRTKLIIAETRVARLKQKQTYPARIELHSPNC